MESLDRVDQRILALLQEDGRLTGAEIGRRVGLSQPAASARILRMEIPYGHFERRIELPPVPFRISGRHLANGCLMLRLEKGTWR